MIYLVVAQHGVGGTWERFDLGFHEDRGKAEAFVAAAQHHFHVMRDKYCTPPEQYSPVAVSAAEAQEICRYDGHLVQDTLGKSVPLLLDVDLTYQVVEIAHLDDLSPNDS